MSATPPADDSVSASAADATVANADGVEGQIQTQTDAAPSADFSATIVVQHPDVRITSDAELEAGLRTIIEDVPEAEDADRTIGMDSQFGEAATGGATDAADSQVNLATEVFDSSRQKPSSGSNADRGKSRASETELNIPERRITWTDTENSFASSADYEIIPVSGKTELKGALGKGGVGIVWKAMQRSLNREVAIKQLADLKTGQSHSKAPSGKRKVSERDRRSFLAEAVITAKLEHPNIMPVYDLVTDDEGNRLYTMKLLRNPSWDQVIDDKTEEENLDILRKVCEAIDFAHEQGIVHRDLKPANIVVGDHGEVLVIDWGLAFPLAHFQGPDVSPTQTGRGGSPTYMAPEQTDVDPDGIGPHTDIYLLGAILFEIVTGLPPHPYRTSAGKSFSTPELFKIVADNIIIDVEQTGELVDIARRAMQTLPRDRYASVKQFLEALKSYQKHTESTQLVRQANRDLQTANQSQDYAMFARSVYGFENAQQLWEANHDAREGLLNARLGYAQAALVKKDFDLGLTLVRADHPAEAGTYKRLVAGREERRRQFARAKLYRLTAAIALVGFVGAIATGSWIVGKKNLQLASKNAELDSKNTELVDANQKIAAEKSRAEANALEAIEQRKIADTERLEAVRQTQIAVAKQIEADEQRMIAEENELLAKQNEEKAVQEEKIAKEQRSLAEMAADAERIANQKFLSEWYRAQLQLADRHINTNAFDSARDVLSKIERQLETDQDVSAAASDQQQAALAATHRALLPEVERLRRICDAGNIELVKADPTQGIIGLTAVAASPQLLATANVHGEIQLWSPEKRRTLLPKPIQISTEPTALALSPDSQLLAVGDRAGDITLWDTQTGESRGVLHSNDDREIKEEITRIVFLPDRAQLASTSGDQLLRIWNLDGPKTSTLHRGHAGRILSLARVTDHKDATLGLLTGGDDGQLRFWNLTQPEVPASIQLKRPRGNDTDVTSLAAVPMNSTDNIVRIFFGDDAGDIQELRIPFTRLQTTQPGDKFEPVVTHTLTSRSADRHTDGLTGLLLDPVHPDRLISVGRDNLARTWDLATRTTIRELKGHGNAIVDAAVWKDSTSGLSRLLTASIDGTARLWEPEAKDGTGPTGDRVMSRIGTATGDVLAVSVAKHAERVLAVSRDGLGMVWDLSRENSPQVLDEGHHFLTQAAIKRNHLLVTVSFDGTAAIWDTQANAMLEKLNGVGATGVLAGSHDGRHLITGFSPTADEPWANLRIWSFATQSDGQSLVQPFGTLSVGQTVKKDADQPEAVAISPSGRWAVVGTRNGFVQAFSLQALQLQTPIPAHPLVRNQSQRVPSGVMGVVFLQETAVATAGLDGWLRFWTIENGELRPDPNRQAFEYRDPDGRQSYRVKALVASEDGRTLATSVRFPSQAAGRSPGDLQVKPQIWLLEVNDHGARVIAKVQPEGVAEEKVLSLALTADGQKVLAAIDLPQPSGTGRQSLLREWTISRDGMLDTQDVFQSLPGDGSQFSQASYASRETADEIIVTGNALTSIWKRDPGQSQFQQRQAAYGPMMAMHACDLSADGTIAVTASHDLAPASDGQSLAERLRGEIRVWKIQSDQQELKASRIASQSIPGAVNSVAICPADSTLMAIGGYQRSKINSHQYSAQLCRLEDARLQQTQEIGAHDRPIISVRFSADGLRFVSVSTAGLVQVANRTGMEVEFQPGPKYGLSELPASLRLGELLTADLSHDGRLLVVADRRAFLVVNTSTGNPVTTELLQGHASDLTDVRFSSSADANGPPRLWSTSLDGSIKYWSLSDPDDQGRYASRPMMTLRGHQRGVLALAALRDGGIASGGADGRVILWPNTPPIR